MIPERLRALPIPLSQLLVATSGAAQTGARSVRDCFVIGGFRWASAAQPWLRFGQRVETERRARASRLRQRAMLDRMRPLKNSGDKGRLRLKLCCRRQPAAARR
jgi:hypothetical protein